MWLELDWKGLLIQLRCCLTLLKANNPIWWSDIFQLDLNQTLMKAVIPPHSSLSMPGWTHDRWRPTSHWGLIALGKHMEETGTTAFRWPWVFCGHGVSWMMFYVLMPIGIGSIRFFHCLTLDLQAEVQKRAFPLGKTGTFGVFPKSEANWTWHVFTPWTSNSTVGRFLFVTATFRVLPSCVASTMCAMAEMHRSCVASTMCPMAEMHRSCVASTMCASSPNVTIPTPPTPSWCIGVASSMCQHRCVASTMCAVHRTLPSPPHPIWQGNEQKTPRPSKGRGPTIYMYIHILVYIYIFIYMGTNFY